MHPWIKGIQVNSNNGPVFPNVDNKEILKLNRRNCELFIKGVLSFILKRRPLVDLDGMQFVL